MTEIERSYLVHCLKFADLCVDGARISAAGLAEKDHYELARLPALLERSLQKRKDMAEVS